MSNMVVQTNVLALNSHRNLKGVGSKQSTASARLSSGYRINSAADDAAGLAISEKMRSQIRGLNQASTNAQDAISLIQTAEGGMQEIDNMLQRIRELTVQVSNDTQEHNELGSGDRQKIQDEIDQLTEEIDSMAKRVEFNKKTLLDGSFSNSTESITSAATELTALQNEKTTLDTALASVRSNLEKANSDFGQVSADKTAFEAGLALREQALESAIASLSKATSSYTAPANVSAAGVSSAIEKFKNELVTLAQKPGSEFTQGELETIANKYFTTDGTGYNSAGDKLILDVTKTTATDIVKFGALTWTDFGAAVGSIGGSDGDAGNDAGAELNTNLNAALSDIFTNIGKVGMAQRNLNDYDSKTSPDVWGGGTVRQAAFAGGAGIVGHTGTAPGNTTTSYTASGTSTDLYKAYSTFSQTLSNTKAEYATLTQSFQDVQKQIGSKTSLLEGIAGNPGEELYFQVGANSHQNLTMSIGSLTTDVLGIGNGSGVSNIDVLQDTGKNITGYLETIDSALSYVTKERSKLGAAQNRLDYTMKSLDTSSENLSASESRIRNADMAKEMMALTQANVLQQAATSMLAQANQAPQAVLQLLG